MNRLGFVPPAWVSDYVGLNFEDRGRSRSGLDCWGLVRLVYAERWGVSLPDLSDRYTASEDSPSVGTVLGSEAAPGGSWRRREGSPLVEGDVGVFRVRGTPGHVGIAVSRDKILHILRGSNSIVEAWTSPLWSPRSEGWFQFAGPVDLRVRRSIFESVPRRIDLPEGPSVEDMVRAGGLDPDAPGVRVYVGDREVRREHWSRVRPKAGRRVTVGVVPEGGGKDFARILLVIAVIVAAVFIGPQVALLLGYTATGSAAAIATAVVGLAGTLAVNALVPPPSADLSGAGDGLSKISPTIAGARNEVRRYSPVPAIFGRHRVTPAFGALPYTEIVGDDQYLRCLFVVGYGPLELSDFRIGETPINEFDGIEYEVREGVATDTPTSIYPGTVIEDAEQVLVAMADGWILRTTDENADEISIDFTFPRGLAIIETDGSRSSTSVSLEVQYAPVGTGAWQDIDATVPTTTRELDYFFRTPESLLVSNGNRTTPMRVNWSANGVFADAPPAEVSSALATRDSLAWEFEAIVQIPARGDWQFSIDSSDPADLYFDGYQIATFYGSHPRTGPAVFGASGPQTSQVYNIRAGFHRIRVRVAARDASSMAIALGWTGPGVAWEAIPASRMNYRVHPNQNEYEPGYSYRVFDPSAFVSSRTYIDDRVDQIRRSVSFAVPRGQYDIRVRRTTADSASDRVIDAVYWTAIRTIRNSEPILVPNLARVALRIKATDQLSGVIDNFNLVASSRIPDYDAASGEWVDRVTSNPASIYRAILQGEANPKKVNDSRLDLAALEEWHVVNTANGFAGNLVFDFDGTLFDRLRQVATTGRASFGMADGLFSIVRDRVQTTPVQHFTPRNSKNFKGRRSFPDTPHAIRVRFLNEERGYQQDERVVYDDGYDATNATRFESLELFGVTSPSLAWRHGRYYIAVGRLRPETFELSVDFEHLICRRGDLVLVTHDVPLLGSHFGRVRQVFLDTAGLAAAVEVDAPVEMESGRYYGIRFRRSDGVFVSREIITESGQKSVLYFTAPIAIGEPIPEVNCLFGFGDLGYESREMIVRSISMGPDLSATLLLVDHAAAVHSADTGEIPAFDSGINRPPSYEDGPEAPRIDAIRSDDGVMVRGPDGTLVPRIVVYLRRPSASDRPVPVWIQGRYREASGGQYRSVAMVPVDGLTMAFLPVDQGIVYDLAVRYLSADGRSSVWTNATTTVEGHSLPPPDVQSFGVTQLGDGMRRYSWELGTPPPDVVGVRLRYREISASDGDGLAFTWESMDDLLAGGGVTEGASPTDLALPSRPAYYRFAIKMVDAGGLESINAVFANARLGPPPRDSVAWIEDCKSRGWPGTKTNCQVSEPGGELVARSQRTWATVPSPWSDWRTWTPEPYPTIEYQHPDVDVGFVFDFLPVVEYSVEGNQPIEILFDYSEDGVVWNGWTPFEVFEGRTVRGRFFRVKASVGNAGDYPIPTLYSLAVALYAPTIVEVLDNLVTAALPPRFRIGPGNFFAPIARDSFATIRTVSVTFNGTGAGWSWDLVSRNVETGPEVRIYDPSDTLADATVDVTVRGIRSSDGSTNSSPPGALQFSNRRNAAWLAVI